MALAKTHLGMIAAVILWLAQPSLQITQYVDDPSSCDIIGDGDIYGIGVRLGYYFSWLSGLIAVVVYDSQAVRDTRKGVTLISLAVFIIIIRNTQNGSFALLEWELLFPMAIWAPLFILLIPSMTDQHDALGASLLIAVLGSVLLAHPWVWFKRTQQGRRPGCEVRAFFFAYFDLYNMHYQRFSKFMAILYCITGLSLMFGALGKLLMYLVGARIGDDGDDEDNNNESSADERRTRSCNSTDRQSNEDPQNTYKDRLRYTFMFLRFIFLAPSGILTIAFGEMILAGNNIDLRDAPLLSSGQLIPFIVGVAGLVSTVWSVTAGKYMAKGRKKKQIKGWTGTIRTLWRNRWED